MSNPIYFVSGLIGHKFLKRKIYESGSGSHVLNQNTKIIFVQAYGAGGAGGGATVDPASPPLSTNSTDKGFAVGSGGGAGGYVELWLPVTGGTAISYSVGAGGIGTSLYGGNGGDTTFGSVITAEGGLGGITFISELKTNGSISIPATMDDPNFRQLVVSGATGGSGTIVGADPDVDTGLIFDGGDGLAGLSAYSDCYKILSVTSGIGGMSSRSSVKNINLIGKFDVSSTIISGTSGALNLNANGYGNGGNGAYAVCNGSIESDNGGNGANGALIITEYST